MAPSDAPHTEKLRQRNEERSKGRQLKGEERRYTTELSKQKAAALDKDIQNEWDRQDEMAAILANKHGKKVEWILGRLQRLPRYTKKSRAINSWNALNHIRNFEIDDDLPPDDKKRLQDLQKIAREVCAVSEVSPADLEEMKKCLQRSQESKVRGVKKQKLARAHDIKNTAKLIQGDLMDLDVRCQMASFFVTVRTSSEYLNAPDYYANDTVHAFLENQFNMSVEDFCMRLDSFAILGLRGLGKNDNERRTILKARIRALVTLGLRKTTENNKAKMSWMKYEELVVIKQGVVLEGWPNPTFDPHNLGIKELQQILAMLINGTCAWRKLTKEELALRQKEYTARLANGDINVRNRKKRSDAGKKRKTVSNEAGKKRKAVSDLNDDADNNASSSRKRPRGNGYVSSNYVDDDDDDDDDDDEEEEEKEEEEEEEEEDGGDDDDENDADE